MLNDTDTSRECQDIKIHKDTGSQNVMEHLRRSEEITHIQNVDSLNSNNLLKHVTL